MTKFRPYSRRELRRRRKHWARRNLKLLAVVTASTVALVAVPTALLVETGPGTGFSWYLLGCVHAGVIGAFLHLLQSAFLAHDREAIWHLRGAWGEENTRDELQRAKRRRLIWGWVDSINLEAGDLDHLVVTRQGGLVAIDSKWRTEPQVSDGADMARAAGKARRRAEGLAQTLLRSDRGARHRARTNPLTVRSVVVLWGAAQHHIPDGAQIDGVEFIAGRRLVAWLRQLDGQLVSKDAARDALDRLNDYRAGSWDDTRTSVR